MITYYPDGSWSTEAIGSNGVEMIRSAIERLSNQAVKDQFEVLVRSYIDFAEYDGSFNYTDDCDHDCRDCEYADCCDDCEYSDVCDHECGSCEYADCCEEFEPYDEEDEDDAAVEDKGAPNPTPDIHVEEVDPCRDCEFHVAGFPCSKTTKKKKGCAK